MVDNPYILPGGRTYAARDRYLSQIKSQQATIDKIDKTLEKIAKRNKWIVGGAIVAVQIAVEVYDSVVVKGLNWDDASERIISSSVSIGIGIGVEAVGTWFATSVIKGSAGGMGGVIVAAASGAVVTFYDVYLKEPVEDWQERRKDEWQQLKW